MINGKTIRAKCIEDYKCCGTLCFKKGEIYKMVERQYDDKEVFGYTVPFDNMGEPSSVPINIFKKCFEIVKPKKKVIKGAKKKK